MGLGTPKEVLKAGLHKETCFFMCFFLNINVFFLLFVCFFECVFMIFVLKFFHVVLFLCF